MDELIRFRRGFNRYAPDAADALSDSEIRDELLTLRGAGFETTSNTMCSFTRRIRFVEGGKRVH